jgi:hypothetical protein
VARPEEPKFLGFSISSDRSERRIAPKAVDKFKTRIRNVTRRTREISLPQLIKSWRHTSSDGAATSAAVRRQWQSGPDRFKEVPRRGAKVQSAAAAVHRRGSGACQHTPRSNKPRATTISTHSVSHSMSLPKPNLVEPPWNGPVCPVVGEGWRREVCPYPDQWMTIFHQNR